MYCRSDIGGFAGGEIPNVSAEMGIMPVGRAYWDPGRPAQNGAITIRAAGRLERSNADHTFNFVIPGAEAVGALLLRFRVDVTNFGNRSYSAYRTNLADVATFIPVRTIDVLRVRYNWNGNTPSVAAFNNTVRNARALYPIARVVFSMPQPGDQVIATPHDLSNDDGLQDAFDDLEDLADEYRDNGEYWVAMSEDFNRGRGWDRRQICYVGDRLKMAHELGHAHKLNHVNAGGAESPFDAHDDGGMVLDVPFDVPNMVVPVDPAATGGFNDIMGYPGGSSGRWVSHVTWTRMLARRIF